MLLNTTCINFYSQFRITTVETVMMKNKVCPAIKNSVFNLEILLLQSFIEYICNLQESLSNKTSTVVSMNNTSTITDDITMSQWIENLAKDKKHKDQ